MLLEAAAAAGSCVLAPSLTELKHTIGWFLFLFFIIYFLNYRLLLELFWQQRGNGYMIPKGSVQINYPLNATISQVKEGLSPQEPHRAHVSVTQPWAPSGRQVSALCLLKSLALTCPKAGESCGIARPCLASLVPYSLVWG